MKFHNVLVFAACTVPALAQHIVQIGYPPAGFTVQRGSRFLVEVDRPVFGGSATNIGVGIALMYCGDGINATCPDLVPMGAALYAGPYEPGYTNINGKIPHQNYTVAIPETWSRGTSRLSVMYATLLGATSSPHTAVVSTTLNII